MNRFIILTIATFALIISCSNLIDPNELMVQQLAKCYERTLNKDNVFAVEQRLKFCDSMLNTQLTTNDRMGYLFRKGLGYIEYGKEKEAIQSIEKVVGLIKDPYEKNTYILMVKLALANLRLGERQNCVFNHTNESCLLPIQGTGIYINQDPSNKAIQILTEILQRYPEDYESLWLLNIAYMTIGKYPNKVPKNFLIPNLDKDPKEVKFKPFVDVAPLLQINPNNLAGGSIVDDFDGDGNLDIITSDWSLKGQMHYYKNNGVNGFKDLSVSSNLSKFTGGLNIMQTDYDNDGDLDIYVLRGAWLAKFGKQPNSLLRNNGDETFTDVTEESGLISNYPTQAAVWRDFNKDGWLDVFIGNEASDAESNFPCQLFINLGNGKFLEVAKLANCDIVDFIKGVTSGDFDNDGWEDLFLSSLSGKHKLLKNIGPKNNIPQFVDATKSAGLADFKVHTFPTWFWDYNNDGWLDLFVSGYEFGVSLAHASCTEKLGIKNNASKLYLFKNNQNGTFTNVSTEAGLDYNVFSMGANFGDVNNDGYVDMYLGTGNPDFESLVPNRLFINNSKGQFSDVTVAARVGNLQKGHGVSISDIDNDGDQDIFAEIGGAFVGDYFHNSLFLNPGQNNNNWIHLSLTGTITNHSAIGSRIRITINEGGIRRQIYKDINSGGSFGSSSLRSEIGLGQAVIIEEIRIQWQKSGAYQYFKNVPVNQHIKITENDNNLIIVTDKKIKFTGDSSKIAMCKPAVQ